MAIYMTVVMGGTPLGAPIIGLVGEHLGPRWTLIIGGLAVLAGTALALGLLARLDRGARQAPRKAATAAF
jgi:predicted MFS family arabinose efflux permease